MSWLQAPLIRALRDPDAMAGFGEAQWDLAIRQARSADLLGRLGCFARQRPTVWASLPPSVVRHFNAAQSVVTRQHKAVHWEALQIVQAVQPIAVPIMFLKGAAYAISGAPAAVGRTFSDVDILVPKTELAAVEMALNSGGWVSSSTKPYEQRYYRQWMHELPPMVHLQRHTTLDVHHAILPETARIRSSPELLLAGKEAVPAFAGMYVPSAEDQILHSACHLFHEGEWAHGLRDLSDLDLMLRAYGGLPGAGERLLARAAALNLAVPLAYAVRCAQQLLLTPLPDALTSRLNNRRWMDQVFIQAMRSAHGSLAGPATSWAQRLLYVRGHWLRMPLHLLLPHLAHQAFARKGEVSA